MLEAVLKRIKYVKERSHPAKNWMAFIVVFFCYLVFCIFGDWRVCVLCVFCVAVFLTVFSVCHCVMLSGQLCQKCAETNITEERDAMRNGFSYALPLYEKDYRYDKEN